MIDDDDAINTARRVLGVSDEATLSDVRAAFRQRSMETHPDRDGSAEAFATVRAAYALLLEVVDRDTDDDRSEADDPRHDTDWLLDDGTTDVDIRVVDEPSTPRRKGFEEMLFEALRREYRND